ncbi:ammonium transporter [Enterococcus avium]|uniref:Ammonium transporter n=1 Tax=Enterococcus avium TaxID=33945 RepID=A0ABD5FEU8_ENTAV|nr:ammonium transporter [Enterococcus avium]MDT2397150.1 ammonium transporter [Enterococcus avium]MDT2449225.1 ammonium transporter [Enterococcus avium]MDT2467871.1 ammonium transporter [Enterococcus avium]MDT2469833.1 ammonium transporter [Enterococcus avium]MDT2485297.1 ammonium transporter [Enterococcus avium]
MYSSVDVIWTLLGAFLVFFMQAGFTLVESGFTRAKNAGNIIMKNLIDFCFGTVLYWIIGFGIMFGGSSAIFGGIHFFAGNSLTFDLPTPTFLLFQTVFCATAATIVSGAMAERTNFIAYCIFSAVISGLIYPISGHWIWGSGFLAEMGFHDFAGSTAVHMVGGIAAFTGAAIVGPRIGKYTKDKKSNAIPGHNLTLAALGVFILWFSWFGFNGGSTTSMTGDDTMLVASNVLVNTNIAAAIGTLAALIVSWIKYKKPDVSLTLNGTLAGLVGITAGCDMVSSAGASVIGLLAGTAMIFAVEFIDKKVRVDDPVGAVAVHGVCGAFGTILTGLLALDGGLFYGGGTSFLITQIFGVLVTAAWVGTTTTVLFLALKYTVGLRVSEDVELAGLDVTEHGLQSAYSGFVVTPDMTNATDLPQTNPALSATNMFAKEPVLASDTADIQLSATETTTAASANPKAAWRKVPQSAVENLPISMVSVVINENKLDELKQGLEKIGIEGLTVTQVLGHGIQKGNTEYYRGSVVPTKLLPKVKVDVVISSIPIHQVINTMKQILHTGKPGDGKIFVSAMDNVVRISNSDEGTEALQGYTAD